MAYFSSFALALLFLVQTALAGPGDFFDGSGGYRDYVNNESHLLEKLKVILKELDNGALKFFENKDGKVFRIESTDFHGSSITIHWEKNKIKSIDTAGYYVNGRNGEPKTGITKSFFLKAIQKMIRDHGPDSKGSLKERYRNELIKSIKENTVSPELKNLMIEIFNELSHLRAKKTHFRIGGISTEEMDEIISHFIEIYFPPIESPVKKNRNGIIKFLAAHYSFLAALPILGIYHLFFNSYVSTTDLTIYSSVTAVTALNVWILYSTIKSINKNNEKFIAEYQSFLETLMNAKGFQFSKHAPGASLAAQLNLSNADLTAPYTEKTPIIMATSLYVAREEIVNHLAEKADDLDGNGKHEEAQNLRVFLEYFTRFDDIKVKPLSIEKFNALSFEEKQNYVSATLNSRTELYRILKKFDHEDLFESAYIQKFLNLYNNPENIITLKGADEDSNLFILTAKPELDSIEIFDLREHFKEPLSFTVSAQITDSATDGKINGIGKISAILKIPNVSETITIHTSFSTALKTGTSMINIAQAKEWVEPLRKILTAKINAHPVLKPILKEMDDRRFLGSCEPALQKEADEVVEVEAGGNEVSSVKTSEASK